MKSKTKIVKLCYNAMFKAVFSNNKLILTKLIEAILEYTKLNINIKDNKIIAILGKTSLSVYLISDNPNLRDILWKDLLKVQ